MRFEAAMPPWEVPMRGASFFSRRGATVAHRPHKPKLVGSTPTSATTDNLIGKASIAYLTTRGEEKCSFNVQNN